MYGQPEIEICEKLGKNEVAIRATLNGSEPYVFIAIESTRNGRTMYTSQELEGAYLTRHGKKMHRDFVYIKEDYKGNLSISRTGHPRGTLQTRYTLQSWSHEVSDEMWSKV